MTEKNLGASLGYAIVREGDEAFARGHDLVEEHGSPPCCVRHPDAGGQCERAATMQVYGLAFCEVHGAEAKAGALEELYHDAASFLRVLDDPHVTPPNPAALKVLREAVSRLETEEARARSEEALRRAYPVVPERVDEDTADFDYRDPEAPDSPIDWHSEERMLLHKLMRIAYLDGGAHYVVEALEQHRERVSAQLAFAFADYDERVGRLTSR